MTRPALRHDLSSLPQYVPGKPSTPTGFKLSSNELCEPPSADIVTAVTARAVHLNRYPDLSATPLGGRLADHLGVDVARVFSAAGSIAALQELILAVVDPGRSVVFGWRSYEAYPILVRVCHAVPVPVPLAGHHHDLAQMADAVIESDAAMVIVCNPNNPTGTTVGRAELEAFLERVPMSCVVVLDEAYREFVNDPDSPDGLDLANGRPNVVVLRTFSKAHALAGARVGYGVAPEPIVEAVRAVALPFTVSALAESAAIAALDAWPRQQRVVVDVMARRDRFVEQLRESGVHPAPSQANFVWVPDDQCPPGFAAALLSAGVSVREFRGEGLRITIGEPEALETVVGLAPHLKMGTQD